MANPPEALLVVRCVECGKSLRISSFTVSYICYCLNNNPALQAGKKKKRVAQSVAVTSAQRAEAKKLEIAAAKEAATTAAKVLVTSTSRQTRTRRTKAPKPSSPFKREKQKKDKEVAKVAKKEEKKALKKKKILKRLFVTK